METIYHCNETYCRVLVKLLNESRDPVVLAVAAHDVGQYVKHCDRGKQCVLPITAFYVT
jgi:V-type H+-transporting ATPase subunit H